MVGSYDWSLSVRPTWRRGITCHSSLIGSQRNLHCRGVDARSATSVNVCASQVDVGSRCCRGLLTYRGSSSSDGIWYLFLLPSWYRFEGLISRMSEVRDTGGMVESSESEKEITEISEVEQMNAAEEEELTPLIDNPLVENDSGLQPEVFTEFSQELVSSEPNGGNDEMSQVLEDDNADPATMTQVEGAPDQVAASDANIGENSGKTEVKNEQLENGSSFMVTDKEEDNSKEHQATEASVKQEKGNEEFQGGVVEGSNQSSDFDSFLDGYDSGTEEQQSAFMKELENFYKERSMEFKPPKFYGEGLNCLK
ncbi:hypothetical protein GW17_00009715 [Ensete ventricosum]|nr:hypothetical protein GW17_00009715 [Ensete ventricosum]